MKLSGCLFVALSLNMVFAESVVTISVPEGEEKVLESAIDSGYADGASKYDELLNADDLIVAGSGLLIIDKDLKTAGYKGEVHVKKGATLRVNSIWSAR